MATINDLQDEVVEEFQDFTDWMDKYQMLIDLGNELEPLDEKYKNEQNVRAVYGCNVIMRMASSCLLLIVMLLS